MTIEITVHPSMPPIKDDFETVLDLAFLMISDDGKVNPEDREQEAAIERVRTFLEKISW